VDKLAKVILEGGKWEVVSIENGKTVKSLDSCDQAMDWAWENGWDVMEVPNETATRTARFAGTS